MIRTETVALTVIPAIAYRQKLPSGGSGIVILRSDSAQPGIASISKSSGKAIPTANTPAALYPEDAFMEAITLTNGIPYKKRSAPAAPAAPVELPEEAVEPALEIVVDSDDYQKIVDAYTDKDGKLSYALLNKDLIRFAHSSSIARNMTANKAPIDDICLYVAGTKFRNITRNRKLDDDQVKKMIELLDDVSPRSVLKELKDELRKKMKK